MLETPTCDLTIVDANYGGWYTGGYGGIDFSMIPSTQINNNTFMFEGNIYNTGTQTQVNTQLNIDVNNGLHSFSTSSSFD